MPFLYINQGTVKATEYQRYTLRTQAVCKFTLSCQNLCCLSDKWNRYMSKENNSDRDYLPPFLLASFTLGASHKGKNWEQILSCMRSPHLLKFSNTVEALQRVTSQKQQSSYICHFSDFPKCLYMIYICITSQQQPLLSYPEDG